jgi:multicomponent Na+:H+ antiporter subunit A
MRRSVILDVCVRAEFHTLILVSLYFLFAGHNQPGGGFSGGLIASCAFCLLYVSGGEASVHRVMKVPPTTFLGVGMLFAIVTGIVPLVLGGEFLENSIMRRRCRSSARSRRPRSCSSTPASTSSCSAWCC